MKRFITTAVLAAALVVPQHAGAQGLRAHYLDLLHEARQQFGRDQTRRNLVTQGVVIFRVTGDKRTLAVRPATRTELARAVRRLETKLNPPVPVVTTVAGGSAVPAAAAPSGGGGPGAGTAQCESGGNPHAVDPTGKYRGKWQFDMQTWQAYGGTGDPAAAPVSEQDAVASRVPYDAWPNC